LTSEQVVLLTSKHVVLLTTEHVVLLTPEHAVPFIELTLTRQQGLALLKKIQ
jgi:hypothetical protein